MKQHRTFVTLSLLVILGSAPFSVVALAQDPPGKPAAPPVQDKPKDDKKAATPEAPMDPAHAEWAKKMESTEKHKILAKFSGDFDVKGKIWAAPGQPPMELAGTSKLHTVLGDRFLQENFKATTAGQAFQGMGMLGYDTVKNKFTMSWTDTDSTFITLMEGDCDAAGTVITLFADVPGATGTTKMKYVMTAKSETSHTLEFYAVDATGKGTKTMEIDYVKSSKADKPKTDKKKDKQKDKPAGN